MRVVAIGLGGAGCRIVDRLYATDRRSSKVACVQGLAIDVDEATLKELGGLPEKGKVFFPALDFNLRSEDSDPGSNTATIDIGEIVSRVQNFEAGETDAIIVCCGLGGSMVDVAPHIITALRSSVVEPIFGLVTLPCLAEGEKKSSKAADDIDMLQSLLDGIILFDNETWYKKILAEKAHLKIKERGLAEKLGLTKGERELSPAQATYALLNEGIVRRISLILRAGEFKADGGIDLAEVVLDSGEVLNTMKGMGFITIGYAVEKLPGDPFSFLSKLKPASIFDEEQKKKASRIVELAKQAIYHEVSTPCDMTSAHKALILIAGPSHELSMKGFMTVRKWIDRSIAGLETRSGDYPVMNTKNVAIIIMLSGLENIPRITEIREIRTHFKSNRELNQVTVRDQFTLSEEDEIETVFDKGLPGTRPYSGSVKDEMVILPFRQGKENITSLTSSESPLQPEAKPHRNNVEAIDVQVTGNKYHEEKDHVKEKSENIDPPRIKERTLISEIEPLVHSPHKKESTDVKKVVPLASRVIVTHNTERKTTNSPNHSSEKGISPHSDMTNEPLSVSDQEKTVKRNVRVDDAGTRSTVMERELIVRELQRQRVIAISGHTRRVSSNPQEHQVIATDAHKTQQVSSRQKGGDPDESFVKPNGNTDDIPQKRILVSKKGEKSSQFGTAHGKTKSETMLPDSNHDELFRGGNPIHEKNMKDRDILIKEPSFKAKDGIFGGKIVRKTLTPQARDSGLIHTDIMSRKLTDSSPKPDEDTGSEDSSDGSNKNPDKKKSRHSDISWI